MNVASVYCINRAVSLYNKYNECNDEARPIQINSLCFHYDHICILQQNTYYSGWNSCFGYSIIIFIVFCISIYHHYEKS